MNERTDYDVLLDEVARKRYELLCLETQLDNWSLRFYYHGDFKSAKKIDILRKALSAFLNSNWASNLKRNPTFPQDPFFRPVIRDF